jgi:predicted phage tail protein
VRQTDILGGVSLWSAIWRVTIIRPTPTAPTTDTPAIVDASGIPTFAWNSVEYGVNYILQVDENANFTNPLVDDLVDTLSRSYVVPFTSGQYYWRVRAISEYGIIGPWSTTWTLTVDLIPSAPTLLLPADSATSSIGDPSFSWQGVTNADEYQVQVDNDADFSSPEFDNTAPQTTRGLPAALTDGTYFWRVRGVNALGTSGEWSVIREFTVDIPPAAPALLTPEADSTNTDGLPMLSWEAVAGSFSYEIQVDNNANFSSPVYNSTVDASMREVVLALGNGTYHWRIRAINIMGKHGAWSEVWTFIVDIPIAYP